ncbi:MAG TPA: hypothetical protein VGM17_07975 [Rhizomicrobium sp.]|jgi:hypothetical protein
MSNARTLLRGATIAAALASLPAPACAGAWTLPAGDTQAITGAILSNANATFGSSGHATPVLFRKLLVGSYVEHGILDDVTLIFAPEYATATEEGPNQPLIHVHDFALKAGVRVRLEDSFGVFSAEASFKTAGGFDMSVTTRNDSGKEAELRLLYGTNFTVFHRGGYIDLEVAERYITGARPSETPIDLTVGLKITKSITLMAQSFNIIADGEGKPPYRYYRSHKLEFGVLQRLWNGVYLQSGGFISPFGQNALVEHGADASLWVQF